MTDSADSPSRENVSVIKPDRAVCETINPKDLGNTAAGSQQFGMRTGFLPTEFNPEIFVGDYNGIDAYGGLVDTTFEYFPSAPRSRHSF